MHTYIHTYVHTCTHTYLHAYIHACVYTYIHPYMHASLHTYMHTFLLTANGDEQLEYSMEYSALGQEHHVTEFLSDLSYCIYKARQLPKRRLLQVFVCACAHVCTIQVREPKDLKGVRDRFVICTT